PIAAASYQDKFEGCLAHFGLPETAILAPAQLGNPLLMWEWARNALDTRDEMSQRIAGCWPDVQSLSRKNFTWMLSSASGSQCSARKS
ncbi:MAG: hypothetical protein J0653_01195, partial [Deltaproteobacteria bacterium]|nr:hypothetical protein [Deltaproteobacteria bacterium]